MQLVDGTTVIDVHVRAVPPFPASLAARLDAVRAAGPDETVAFFDYWTQQCKMRELGVPRRNPEDIVHVRRMLARHDLATLKAAALNFFNNFAEPLEERRYGHHMRLFAHHLPECCAGSWRRRWRSGRTRVVAGFPVSNSPA
jgi:sugar phosphate isomerase/epimerase